MIKKIFSRPTGIFSVLILSVIFFFAIFGQLVAPQGPNEINVMNMLQPPSSEHIFGTDELGRDVFSRTILSAQVSMQVSVISVAFALFFGTAAGVMAGYFGGWLDNVLMRVVDVLFAFPVLLLALAIVAILGPGIGTATFAIGVVYVPIFARVARSSAVSVVQEPYVKAAKTVGASPFRTIITHLLPNIAAPLIVQTSVSLAFAILNEAALSFLGLGAQPPTPTWGRMLFDAKGFLDQAWWMAVFPGATVFLTVLAFNLLGDNLRDALDVTVDRKESK
jgi:peptide/nickel transport system permease protein